MTPDEMAASVRVLRACNLRPLCGDHSPEKSEVDGMIQIHCSNCGFTAWIHPQSYADMIAEEA